MKEKTPKKGFNKNKKIGESFTNWNIGTNKKLLIFKFYFFLFDICVIVSIKNSSPQQFFDSIFSFKTLNWIFFILKNCVMWRTLPSFIISMQFCLRHFGIIDQQGMSSVHLEIVLFSYVLPYFTGIGGSDEDLVL